MRQGHRGEHCARHPAAGARLALGAGLPDGLTARLPKHGWAGVVFLTHTYMDLGSGSRSFSLNMLNPPKAILNVKIKMIKKYIEVILEL